MHLCILLVYQALARLGVVGDTCDLHGGQAAGGTYVIVLCKTYGT